MLRIEKALQNARGLQAELADIGVDVRLYDPVADDIDDGQYVSLFQLYLDGFLLSRTGRKRNENE